jgi:oxygen-independent coproporphyrinogen-3 oxidase
MYLYLHIPFCTSRCIYCDFYVVLEKYGGQAAYVDAVCREIQARLEPVAFGGPVELKSLYVGGGTPSLLKARDYAKILEALAPYAQPTPQSELTLELNPNGVRDSLDAYRAVGFNRVSVGVQSFQDEELKRLSRNHRAQEAIQCIRDLQTAEFENLSIDLMYGIPGQTRDSWRSTLEQTLALGVTHVSMYGLKVEPDTPLHRLKAYTPYHLPEEEETVAMFFDARERLSAEGLEPYEFSNLARPGYESRHNLNYWNMGDFIALGASAHGYQQGVRYENPRDLAQYLSAPGQSSQQETYTPIEQLENALMMGLRKAEGVNVPSLEAQYGVDFKACYGNVLSKYAPEGFFVYDGQTLRLAPHAIPVSNSLIAEFFTG